MTTAYLAVLAGGAAIFVASLARGLRTLRLALVLAGLLTAWAAHAKALDIAAAVGLAVALANAAQLVLAQVGARGARLSPEETQMAARVLPQMARPAFRQLLDQGLWIDAQPGETLIREGRPAPHLFYLAEGEAAVSSGGRPLATCGPGHFLGEITILTGAPATATVTLTGRARFWCIGKDALARLLAISPETRPVLEAAFVGDVADKLRVANERLARV